ncbi:MAG: hypothetical protein ABIU85_08915 [Methylotenera sp.]
MNEENKAPSPKTRQQIISKALFQAFKEGETACPLTQSNLISESVPALGAKIDYVYRVVYNRVSKEKGDPENLARLAEKWFWIVNRHNELMRFGWINEGVDEDNDHTRGMAESIIKIYNKTLGYAFHEILDDMQYPYANRTGASAIDLLTGITLVWFCEAEALVKKGEISPVLDKLADAYGALELVKGNYVWDVREKLSKTEVTQSKSVAAKKGHAATTGIMYEEITAYWRANISAKLSNEKGAKELQKRFLGIPHRTLVSYISKAKKPPVC